MSFGEEAVASAFQGESEIRGGDGSIDYARLFPQAPIPKPNEDGADIARARVTGQSILQPATSPDIGMLSTAPSPVGRKSAIEPTSPASESHLTLTSPEEPPSEDEVEPAENEPDAELTRDIEGMIEDLVDEVIAAEMRDRNTSETAEGIGGNIYEVAKPMSEMILEATVEGSSDLSGHPPTPGKRTTFLDGAGQFEHHSLQDESRSIPCTEKDYAGLQDGNVVDVEMQNDAEEEVVLLTDPPRMEELECYEPSAADQFTADNICTPLYFDGADERNGSIASDYAVSTITGSGTVWTPFRRR